jgi:hypothetical protein
MKKITSKSLEPSYDGCIYKFAAKLMDGTQLLSSVLTYAFHFARVSEIQAKDDALQ